MIESTKLQFFSLALDALLLLFTLGPQFIRPLQPITLLNSEASHIVT